MCRGVGRISGVVPRSIPQAWLCAVVMSSSMIAGMSGVEAQEAAGSRTVWDQTYTKEQAARGADAYRKSCASCHGPSLAGGETGPPLVGTAFLENWKDASVGDLYERIAVSMPQETPGSLAAETYADIVARVLERNGFPAGSSELPPDRAVLGTIRVTLTR